MSDNIGILDPDGVNNNPFTNKTYSEEYIKFSKKWRKLPAYENAKQHIKDIINNQVILVVSGTGSGKTVLFPKYVAHALDYKGNIGITLPKQIIAKSAAEFSAKTLDVKLGNEVGYQYKGESKKSNKTKLLYATDGTIVARLMNDPELKDFDAIIIDEAHERKIQIDFLLFLLKQVVKKRPEFKLIIMSATINSEIFARYFDEFKFKQLNLSGKTNYPIKSIFLDKKINEKEYFDLGLQIIDKIMKKDSNDKDTLFFVTSVNETLKGCIKFNGNKNEISEQTLCVEVYSGVDSKKQSLAQSDNEYKNEGYKTKLVISTNVAESSLTIDGIKFVIDSGFELKSYFDIFTKADRLEKGRITKAQARQRMGRTGRTGEGICYHLYTKEEFDNMDDFPEPSIRVTDITNECLRLLNNVGNVGKLIDVFGKFIEPPRQNYIKFALENLTKLNLIKSGKLTSLGILSLKNQGFDYKHSISLICAIYLRCSQELINILSVIDISKNSLMDLFNSPEDVLKILNLSDSKYKKILEEHKNFIKKFKSSHGDHMSALKIYQDYSKKMKNNKKLDIFYNSKTMSKLFKTRSKLSRRKNVMEKDITDEHIKLLGLNNIEQIKYADIKDKLLVCLYVGNKHQIAKKKKGYDKYKVDDVNISYKISKDSYLKNSEPTELLYEGLNYTNGMAEINIATKISSKIKKYIKN